LTTNFDDGLEVAQDVAHEPYDAVMFAREPGTTQATFAHRPYRAIASHTACEKEHPGSTELPLEGRRALVVKIHGVMDRKSYARDNYVITQDDQVDYYMNNALGRLPPGVSAKSPPNLFSFWATT
jgi:hypothetical protein